MTTSSVPEVLRPGNRICRSQELQNGGRGVRFLLEHNGQIEPAFVVRFDDRVVAYLNRCAHKLVELDWQEGEFFEADSRYLVCSTHGALYDPASGDCVSGPCRGASLKAVPISEANGQVWLSEPATVVIK